MATYDDNLLNESNAGTLINLIDRRIKSGTDKPYYYIKTPTDDGVIPEDKSDAFQKALYNGRLLFTDMSTTAANWVSPIISSKTVEWDGDTATVELYYFDASKTILAIKSVTYKIPNFDMEKYVEVGVDYVY